MLRALNSVAIRRAVRVSHRSSATRGFVSALRVQNKKSNQPLLLQQQQRRRQHQRRRLSFFDDLKKSFQEELEKNKELKDATEQVQKEFAKATKSADKEASKTTEAAKKAAEKSKQAARDAATKSQETLKNAAQGTGKQAEEAKKKVKQMSEEAAKKTKHWKESAQSKLGFLSGWREKASKGAQEARERAKKALEEEMEAIKSTEEFQNIRKEVNEATSKVNETVSKAKETVQSKRSASAKAKEGDAAAAAKDEGSLLQIVKRSVTEALGDSSWKDEFRALFKPEKKVKKIKLAGVAGQEMRKAQQDAQQEAKEAAANYDGPTAMMKVDQPKSGWQAFSERLGSTPLISRLLDQSREANKVFSETGAGQAVKGAVNTTKDMRDELRERWETSQNPWVYRLSGWHDTFFAETETAQAIREVQRLDPEFEIEEFLQALQVETIPQVIQNFVEGNNDALRHVLSEGAYAMTYAAMKARVADGHIMDPNILHLEEPTLLLAQVMDKMPPVFLVRSMAHQVNCIRNAEGEVTEGSPSEIRTVVYMMAFQQEIDDELHELSWKIVEFGVHPLEARFI